MTNSKKFIAYNQKTMEFIATGTSRADLCQIAEKACGRFGYIVRECVEYKPLPANWAASDGQWWN